MTARKTRSTRTQKKTDTGSGLPSPPSSSGDGKASDRNVAGPSSAMISPPPEENGDHRSKSLVFVEVPSPKPASKRKRLASASTLLNLTGDPNTTTGEPTTPNPKARKQSRRSKSPPLSGEDSDSPIYDSPTKKSATKSPHALNPQADYLPAGPSYARHILTTRNRRSTTPIPPYEPPTDHFTPPREIIVQPPSAQKKKPRQTKKKTGKQLKLQIKEEPPDIDLNAPIPPPSPTDDPLLLRGPPRSRSKSLPKQSRGTSPMLSPELREKTPPPPNKPPMLPTSSPWSEVDMNNVEVPPMPSSDSMTPEGPEEHPEEPIWQEGPSGWTESSDNEELTFDEEGEYTGKFTSYVVPTKPDPPTTVQRERQEAWGRPISPFPYPTNRKSRWSSPLTPAETQEESYRETQEPEMEPEKHPALDVADLTTVPRDTEGGFFNSDQNTAPGEVTTLSNATSPRQALIPATIQPMFDFDGLSSPDHSYSYETPIRLPKEEPVPFIRFFPKRHSTASSSKIQFPPPQHPSIFNSPARNIADLERDEERFIDRALSHPPEDDDEDDNTADLSQRALHLEQLDVPEEDTEEEDDEGVVDLGVIKISSEDPMAAAKAAAILKLHDYDLVKRAHRRNLVASGISRMSPRRRPKGNPRDGSFVRPISPAAMPELIREAETELEKSFSGSDRFTTPMRTNPSMASTSQSRYIDPSRLFDPTGPREWAKNDWKILDVCFTDERLDAAEKIGMAEGSMADVTDIRLDDVVNRFVEVIGGDAALAVLGPSWMRKDILKRARALEKKQRAGKGAPGTPRRSQTPFSESGHMEVPDFTPIGPRRVVDRLDEGNYRLPATLLAPRYSHLMDEAVLISRNAGGEPSGSSSGVTVKAPPDSPSLFRRITTPLFSYLPLLSRGASGEQPRDADKSGLPLPPPELFEKERDTIVTPAAKLPPKPTHPKDQVELHSVPPKPSMIPKPRMQPRRLVDLRPAPQKPEPEPAPKILANDRRLSGGSVKDLVKSFETLDESVSSLKSSTRSVQSVNEWRAESLGAGSKGEGNSKPQWRP